MNKAGVLAVIVLVGLVATSAQAAVPELDPGSASLGLALLAAGLLLFNGRRPKR